MSIDLFPLISFVLITTFTPGPANISSASMGVLHGYKGALKFLLGLVSGFFFIMTLSGLISATLLRFFPALEPILRYLGAAYILYLAFSILKASYTFETGDLKPMGYLHGLLLQISNPKLLVYAFTLFSTFLAPIAGNMAWLLWVVPLLALIAFSATSTWALFGTVIKTYLHSPRAKTTINIILSLFLIYSAVELAGIL
ncbi:MAG: LysE family translocator [Anaerolineales bacterium]